MRLASRMLCAIACMAAACAGAADEPRTFALVAAMGNVFSAVHEVASTGSHLAPYRKRTFEVKDDTIDRLVLKGLDDAVTSIEPGARKVYLMVRLPAQMQERPSRIEASAFGKVVEELRRMPGRDEWHRIVVATPAYRAAARDGLAGGIEGMGLFTEPLCGDVRDCDARTQPATAGIPATTPSGETVTTSRYVAPYLFAKIWILDPTTLEVLDSQEIFRHEKLFDPDSGATDMNQVIDRKLLAARILEGVHASALEAVRRSELRGRVEVEERGPVKDAR